MEYLKIRILGKIPKEYKSGMVLDENSIGLTGCWDEIGEDKYHVKLKERSVYASIDDIKTHILSINPKCDMSFWGLHRKHSGGGKAYGNGWEMHISSAQLQSLEREHVSEMVYENVLKEWFIEVPYGEKKTLEGLFPGYVNLKLLHACSDTMLASYKGISMDLMDNFMEELEYPHGRPICLPALQAAYAYASANGKKCFARLTD